MELTQEQLDYLAVLGANLPFNEWVKIHKEYNFLERLEKILYDDNIELAKFHIRSYLLKGYRENDQEMILNKLICS